MIKRVSHRGFETDHHFARKGAIQTLWFETRLYQNFFASKVDHWCVMLMQGVNGNALRDGSCSLCKYTAECIVTLVANAAPVHGAKDDRLPCTHKNDAFAPQAQVPHANSRIT